MVTIRGESIRLVKLDAAGRPIPGTEQRFERAVSVELDDEPDHPEAPVGSPFQYRWTWSHCSWTCTADQDQYYWPLPAEREIPNRWVPTEPLGPGMRSHP